MKIICIGRNYAKHAQELKNEIPSSPVIFLKPETALFSTKSFTIPKFTTDCQYELELVLRIGKQGKDIQTKDALTFIDKIALGIDFTARDIQNKLKAKGLPWEKAKAFDRSAYLSKFHDFDKNNQSVFKLELFKNGKSVQKGTSNEMLFSFADIIVECSQYFTLNKDDLIYTGTPSGVGPVKSNDELIGYFNDNEDFSLKIN